MSGGNDVLLCTLVRNLLNSIQQWSTDKVMEVTPQLDKMDVSCFSYNSGHVHAIIVHKTSSPPTQTPLDKVYAKQCIS